MLFRVRSETFDVPMEDINQSDSGQTNTVIAYIQSQTVTVLDKLHLIINQQFMMPVADVTTQRDMPLSLSLEISAFVFRLRKIARVT